MELTLKQKTAFGIGAVGKDMVYAMSASYVMYYYQDVLGLSASFVGVVLMAARFFDAFNDPFMGVLVAKTRTRWGRFRPWIFSGTLLNALVLYALFAAPVLDEAALMVYFSVVYILWGVTYTMMDIPYWSMIPAVTRTPKDRENLSMVGRTCAGVGSALIAMFTMLLVGIYNCGWFGLADERPDACPFCGNRALEEGRQMLRPWGFAPKNAEAVPDAQLEEEYSSVQPPLYSTLPDAEDIQPISGCKNIRMASRTNQRIIMVNQGLGNKGFMVCPDCGAAMPGDNEKTLDGVLRPYKSKYARKPCSHRNARNVNIGYDFITDMLVLEIKLDEQKMDIHRTDNPWLTRAAQSLAEAFRLAASKELDIEFTELVTGYRIRTNNAGAFVDVYLYDSLSSGAGYAVSVADNIETLLNRIRELLASCDCGNACHKCLKHYRNQYVHGLLDRFAALELLDWGVNGELADSLTVEGQKALLLPLESILRVSGCTLLVTNNEIVAKHRGREVKLVVYPAMWKEPREDGTIYVSDAYIKYAKPYAVQKILNV